MPVDQSKKLLDTKWVFKILKDENGHIKRYKARLLARGFQQKEGLDYTETFAPVVRYDSLRVFLATTQLNLELIQFDVKTAFLYSDVKEELYLKIPDGLKVDGDSSAVMCRLNKSLYGIKQAARCWNTKFTYFLRKFNLVPCESEKCIYVGKINNVCVFLALFVNDGLIACESHVILDSIIDELNKSFEITLGDASMFVGL